MSEHKCSLCKDSANFEFRSEYYSPEMFLHGKRNSQIWIVGINPKLAKDNNDHHNRQITYLENYFDQNRGKENNYFKAFGKVSKKVYDLLGMENGVASTDIVKCFSEKAPPEICFINCKKYFKLQLINQLQINCLPKILICNGIQFCNFVSNILNINTRDQVRKEKVELTTLQKTTFHNNEIIIIFSGFISQIDDYAKRRLGIEIEKCMEEYSII